MRLPEAKYRGLRFGVFEADLELHELRKHGLRIKLTGQPFQALIMMLERHGEVVTRDELRNALWPDEPWGDHDQRVNKIVNKIREALCDSAETPRFLETVPRIGYRFLIPVEKLGDGPAVRRARSLEAGWDVPVAIQAPALIPVAGPIAPPPVAARRPNWFWFALACVALIGLGTVVSAVYRSSGKAIYSPRIAEPTPLTTYVGSELYPSFSPDGKLVAFAWDNDSKSGFHIYTAAVGGGDARRITNDAKSDSGPVWSPDGRQIAFLRELSEQRAQVWVAQFDGTQARSVNDIDRAATDHSLSWTNDTGWLVVTARPKAGDPAVLYRMSTKTGEKHQITVPGGQFVGDLSPAISPDGKVLAFARGTSASWRDIYLLNVSKDAVPGGEPVRITDLHRIIDTIAWTPDSRGLVFAAATTTSGARHLFQVDASMASLNHDFAETGIEGDHPAISAVGTKLAYVRKNIEQSSIWRLDLADSAAEPRPSRMVSSTRRDYTADLSPDGKRLVFSSVRSGPSEIWISDTDGSNLKRITSLGASTPRWSPDGRRIAFESNTRGQPDVYIFTVDTNALVRLTSDGASNLRPSWSRDGRYIYFGSNRTGRPQIWKIPSNGGDAIQITRKGGIYAIETFDGKSIYYTSGEQPAIIRTTGSNGGEEADVITGVPGFSTIAMSGDGLYYLSSLTATGAQMDFYNFAKHTSRQLVTIDKPIHRFLSSSTDGRSVLYTQVDKRDSDLMLIDPFR